MTVLTSSPALAGVKGITTQVVTATVTAAPGSDTAVAEAFCPQGELLTGGGYEVFNVSANWSIYFNAPLNNDTWTVEIDNEVTNATTVTSYAQCLAKANSQPVTALTVSTVENRLADRFHLVAPPRGSGRRSNDYSC